MTQILQIFRKDVRHLAPFILALLALQGVFAAGTIRQVGMLDPSNGLEAVVGLCEGLIAIAWAFLVALVVQQDPPIGENAFWLTRPYSRLVVLMAKVLFVLVFLNLPLLISDCCILQILGLPFDLADLLLRQLPLIALLIVPAFAFASISRSLSQFSLFVVMLILAMVCESFVLSDSFHTLFWLRIPDFFAAVVFPLCATFLIFVQFVKRVDFLRVGLPIWNYLAISATFFGTHLIQQGAFFVEQSRSLGTSNAWGQIHLEIKPPFPRAYPANAAFIPKGLAIPLKVTGLPMGTILRGAGFARLGADSAGGPSSLIRDAGGNYFINVTAHADTKPASIQIAMDLWLAKDAPYFATRLVATNLSNIPAVGLCEINHSDGRLVCWGGPTRPLDMTVRVGGSVWFFAREPNKSESDEDSYAYDELLWDFSPVERLYSGQNGTISSGDEVVFGPQFPVGNFHALLEAEHYPLHDCLTGYLLNLDLVR